jgi:hypothetical protein
MISIELPAKVTFSVIQGPTIRPEPHAVQGFTRTEWRFPLAFKSHARGPNDSSKYNPSLLGAILSGMVFFVKSKNTTKCVPKFILHNM